MDLLNVIQPSKNARKRADLQGHLTVKPPSGPVKLTIAEAPIDNGVFVQPEDTFSSRYADDPLTALASNSPTTVLPSYFDDVIVGRITCNNTADGTPFSSFLDCYNDSYFGAMFNNGTGTSNATGGPARDEPLTDVILMGVTSLILGLMILITVIGNVFVIAAILLERNLQNVANYLIVSLAVADLMVACLVMPLGAVYEISKGWILGPELCDMWTSSDVLCCTASILHLVAIAVDRYWAVTNVDYIHTRNGTRIGVMIVVVWSVALVVSLAPQFGWKDPDYLDRINLQQRCLVSQDVAYQIFATCSTFYVPLLVILVLYWKIFQTARKRIHRRRQQRTTVGGNVASGGGTTNKSSNKNPPPPTANVCTSRFITRKRFKRIKSNKSSAAEALVSSLILVEGHSTASVDVTGEEDGDTVDQSQKNSDTSGASGAEGCSDAGNLKDAHSVTSVAVVDGAKVVTTAFTICKSIDESSGAVSSGDGVGPLTATPNNVSPEKSSAATTTNNGSASHQSHVSDVSRAEILQRESSNVTAGGGNAKEKLLMTNNQRRDKKESLEAKRERKAAKTLAIITGAFVVCWLPFFIMALLMPLCDACYINDYMQSFFLWLGYFNSTLNPVIYTIFSPEFRQAFKRILCGSGRRSASRIFRLGKLR
ncbi:5-hydroxytryptamine receptor-like [Zootermopsis nevadensis]|nr:5-hydroxytryptamine receptor-like [Zootermopsis nevadensis]XP_021928089.1 5-hydroxytryptamine receptor-like [Zootermopsis nevadensis]XP_021928090.1 5-hydroxytryptamine receptor-like [Zootermopsis nevadensis]XP_021928091.1 5-hydroxytryptamine receptor-like [Zootermopsis nevadensis]XP_021928092.1 5-hydroxytryptamine receptor-like [Zootermopsis nevadensis]XP_021928093.1 5-hydroxytryptamine receptor-like [Zootermopsis nevadensis]